MDRQIILQELIDLGIEKGRTTIVASTGTGKSYVALKIIQGLPVHSVLIVGPSKALEDNLRREMVKFGFDETKYDLKITTINDAYKYENKEYDILIGDEAHTIVTETYSNLLKNNKFKYIIMLTATPEDYKPEKKLLYDKYAPIHKRYLTSEEDGLVNKVQVIHFTYALSNAFKTVIEYTKGKQKLNFKKGELNHYAYLSDKFTGAKGAMASVGSEDFYTDHFEWLKTPPTAEHKKAAFLYHTAVTRRKKFLLNLDSLTVYSKLIINRILTNEKYKLFYFTEEINHAKSISDIVFVPDDKESIGLIDKFSSGEIRCLGSAKALNAGINVKGLTHGLFSSYVGSSTTGTQRAGRLNRLQSDDLATLIILHPTGTQYDKWYLNMIEGMNFSLDIIECNDINTLFNLLC